MGFYNDRILPWLITKAMGSKELVPLRQKVLSVTNGTIVELGIGSGANLPYYPATIERLIGIDSHPRLVQSIAIDSRMSGKAEVKIADATAVPIGDGIADYVVSTFTLCSVPNVAAVLNEVRRILKPGGRFIFLEHGLSDKPSIQRWQNFLTPINRRVAGGCCLNRNYAALLHCESFSINSLDHFYLAKVPKTHGYLYQGVASPLFLERSQRH